MTNAEIVQEMIQDAYKLYLSQGGIPVNVDEYARQVTAELKSDIGRQLLMQKGLNLSDEDLDKGAQMAKDAYLKSTAVARKARPLAIKTANPASGFVYLKPTVDDITGEDKTRTTGGAALPEVATTEKAFTGLTAPNPVVTSTTQHLSLWDTLFGSAPNLVGLFVGVLFLVIVIGEK